MPAQLAALGTELNPWLGRKNTKECRNPSALLKKKNMATQSSSRTVEAPVRKILNPKSTNHGKKNWQGSWVNNMHGVHRRRELCVRAQECPANVGYVFPSIQHSAKR